MVVCYRFHQWNTGESRKNWPYTYGVCSRALGCIVILKVLLHTSQVCEYVHLTKVTNMLLWLIFCLLLPILTCFYIGACVFPTCWILCIWQSMLTNTRKLKCMDFWWSHGHDLVKFGPKLKQSLICHMVYRETVHDSHAQHVMVFPAQCRWHNWYALCDIP